MLGVFLATVERDLGAEKRVRNMDLDEECGRKQSVSENMFCFYSEIVDGEASREGATEVSCQMAKHLRV